MTTDPARELTRREFGAWLAIVLAIAALMRGLFPAADPPWNPSVGIVWHDEGAWVHNARNRALFGSWIQDEWNPLYIAPVFTALEYASFAAFGVGVRQARLVPEVLGCVSVALLGLGVARIAGRRAGLAAAALLATNYVYVMWNRAALMEAPMTAFLVASWYCYTRFSSGAWWAWGAAAAAWLAFFTKAAAAFYLGALGLEALIMLVAAGDAGMRRRAGVLLAAIVVSGAAAFAAFVLPNWDAYWFYNVQMSITRKPSYDFQSVLTRVTWFPILHDLFTRMWLTVVLATAALFGLAVRWRSAAPAERLLAFWIVLGALELLVHDVGNERRFVFFIPPLTALAAILIVRDRALFPVELGRVSLAGALLAAPLVGYGLYVLFGSIVRLAFLYEIRPNVRLAAALAMAATVALYATWPRLPRLLATHTWTARAGLVLASIMAAGQVAQYLQWAVTGRSYANYEASVMLGRVLPAGTLVHGKLANGLALENVIRPVFVGRGFGNYEDRRSRDDVRYILTYTAPSLGYESQRNNPVIMEVLEAYPNHAIIMEFDVRETTTGRDRAALIDKFGGTPGGMAHSERRAHN